MGNATRRRRTPRTRRPQSTSTPRTTDLAQRGRKRSRPPSPRRSEPPPRPSRAPGRAPPRRDSRRTPAPVSCTPMLNTGCGLTSTNARYPCSEQRPRGLPRTARSRADCDTSTRASSSAVSSSPPVTVEKNGTSPARGAIAAHASSSSSRIASTCAECDGVADRYLPRPHTLVRALPKQPIQRLAIARDHHRGGSVDGRDRPPARPSAPAAARARAGRERDRDHPAPADQLRPTPGLRSATMRRVLQREPTRDMRRGDLTLGVTHHRRRAAHRRRATGPPATPSRRTAPAAPHRPAPAPAHPPPHAGHPRATTRHAAQAPRRKPASPRRTRASVQQLQRHPLPLRALAGEQEHNPVATHRWPRLPRHARTDSLRSQRVKTTAAAVHAHRRAPQRDARTPAGPWPAKTPMSPVLASGDAATYSRNRRACPRSALRVLAESTHAARSSPSTPSWATDMSSRPSPTTARETNSLPTAPVRQSSPRQPSGRRGRGPHLAVRPRAHHAVQPRAHHAGQPRAHHAVPPRAHHAAQPRRAMDPARGSACALVPLMPNEDTAARRGSPSRTATARPRSAATRRRRPIDLARGLIHVQRARQHAVAHRHHHLDHPGHARGGLRVADVGLDRPQPQRLPRGPSRP